MKPATALCVDCGEAVPLRVRKAPAPCPHCHSEAALPTDLRARLEALGERLGERAPGSQRLLQRPTPLRGWSSLRLVALPVGLLLLFSLLLVAGADDGPWDFFTEVHGRDAGWFEWGDHSRWWAVAVWLVGAAIAVLWGTAVAIRMRRVVRHCWPRVPFAGGLPRCRLCGDDLPRAPTAAALVRCARCHADHVVVPGRHRATPRKADSAIDDFARAIDRPVTLLEAEAMPSVGAAIALTAGPLAFGGLAALFLRTTSLVFLGLMPALLAVAGGLYAFARWRWPIPTIPFLGTLPVGTEVSLGDRRLTVLTVLAAPWWRRGDRRPWVLLGEARVAQPVLALRLREERGRVDLDAFELDEGGDGRGEGEALLRLHPSRDSRVLAEGRAPVYLAEAGALRLYKGSPDASSVPRFTLEPAELDESDVTVVG